MSIYSDYESTDQTCPACGAPVQLRIERFDSFQKKGAERRRALECSADASHDLS